MIVPEIPMWVAILLVAPSVVAGLFTIFLIVKFKKGETSPLAGTAVIFVFIVILSLLIGSFANTVVHSNLVSDAEATWGIEVDSRVGSERLLNGEFTFLKNKVPYTGRLYVDENRKAHLIEVDGMMEIQPVQPAKVAEAS